MLKPIKFDPFDVQIDQSNEIELYIVQGIAGYWPTKIVAETLARRHFPTDSHLRIKTVTFVQPERIYS